MSLERFEELYDRVDLGNASTLEREELTALLRADPDCRRRLAENCLRDAQLRKLVSGETPALVSGSLQTAGLPVRRWQWVAGWAAAALVLLVAGWLVASLMNVPPVPSQVIVPSSTLPSLKPSEAPLYVLVSGVLQVNGRTNATIFADAVLQTPAGQTAELQGEGLRLRLWPKTTVQVHRPLTAGSSQRLNLLAGQLEIRTEMATPIQVVTPLGLVQDAAGQPGQTAWRVALSGELPAETIPGSAADLRRLTVRVSAGAAEVRPPAGNVQAVHAVREPTTIHVGEKRTFRSGMSRDPDDDVDDDEDDDAEDDGEDDGGPAAADKLRIPAPAKEAPADTGKHRDAPPMDNEF